jgi:hypothetical protein
MTNQKMPDEIWANKIKGTDANGNWSLKQFPRTKCYIKYDRTSYTRTDLYTDVVAERDALRALCEGMAGALTEMCNLTHTPTKAALETLAAFEKHTGVNVTEQLKDDETINTPYGKLSREDEEWFFDDRDGD